MIFQLNEMIANSCAFELPHAHFLLEAIPSPLFSTFFNSKQSKALSEIYSQDRLTVLEALNNKLFLETILKRWVSTKE